MRLLFAAALLALAVQPALARGSGGGHYSGHVSTFRTSQCVSSSCYSKHPNGSWVHPITPRRR
jgi:hypothetical protein